MPNRFGFGGGWGFAFRGSSPPWPYVGLGRGGLPRCWYFLGPRGVAPGYQPYPYYGAAPWATPYAPQMPREQELDFLRSEAQAAKEQLEQIEARIRELTKEEG